ncbi:MAG TPA: glycoside hydrolase family 36 N-terminal domain-containing protein, partial [Chitinophagaceae bacterium]|nr:glycoside hydrolase family 36 N-terminal domain-containing protein [Chitinophagaceae bacterium]
MILKKRLSSCLLLLSVSCFLTAQQPVSSQPTQIVVQTAASALVLQTDKSQNLDIIYLGKKLQNADEYGQSPSMYRQSGDDGGMLSHAYTPAGTRNLAEPAITVTHADGNNSLDLHYVSHQVNKINEDVSLVSVLLKDPVYDFEVTLYYKTYFRENVVEQWSVIRHHEKGDVVLQKFASANLYLRSESF